ncbi:Transcription factor bHLH143 like [Actinidia chinensis var. chinensis]|uniref:Transcription factor bHLH143 like n=1 Tax=Actinidia chinensis var. chinensis TaxID=1590841 RepID=A0A2R6QY86_ACTCC|nr:Transcription factor bHLH143 like [Actinidia chinensis var. chinensis]
MEKDFGSWSLHQQFDWLTPNLNTPCVPFNPGQWNTIPAYMSHCANVDSTNGTSPWFPFSGIPDSNTSQLNEPQSWFYCLPRLPQTTPVQNTNFIQKNPDGPCENREVVSPNKASGHAQRRFLVFDQSRDQTKLIFSSGIGTPVQCLTSWGPKLNSAYDLNKSELGTGRDTIHCPGPILTDECNENVRDDVGSEMHEDTEELNALLYSDDDEDYDDDDEEASTGHSPSTMTVHDKQERFEESAEEVASSGGPTKRMKMSDGGYVVPSLTDTASSVKPKICSDYEDDAESSCADGKNQSGDKRSKDKIRETVSVLQKMIPGGEGKDAIVILDEAISYLRLLKRKAKALGVDTL